MTAIKTDDKALGGNTGFASGGVTANSELGASIQV